MANVKPDDDVPVFWAGSVGYFAVEILFDGCRPSLLNQTLAHPIKQDKRPGAEVINFDVEGPVDFIKKRLAARKGNMIYAAGFEAVGHMSGIVISARVPTYQSGTVMQSSKALTIQRQLSPSTSLQTQCRG